MFDHKNGRTVLYQCLKDLQKCLHVQRMQTNRWLVKDKHAVILSFAHLARQLQALRLAAGKARGLFTECQISKSQMLQHFQSLLYRFQSIAGQDRRIDIHLHQLWQAVAFFSFIRIINFLCRFAVTRASALRTWNIHIRQKLYIQTDLPRTVTYRAAQLSCIVREIPCFIAARLCILGAGKFLPQLIVHIGVGRYRRAHIDPDRRRIDQLCMCNPLCLYLPDMLRQLCPLNASL